MTNKEIIISNTAALIADGIIKEDETINTFIGWKMRGFQVKRGETHIAEFPIWNKNKRKQKQVAEESEEQTDNKPHRDFILTNAYWFSNRQVERIQ